MVKQGGSGGDINLGSDAWNVADGYTKIKVLDPLIKLDIWDTMSQFGTLGIDEDIGMDNNQIKKRRVEALQRFHSTIKQLLGNVIFALRKEDQDPIKALVKRVDTAGDYIPKAFSTKEDMIHHEEEFEIEEPLFKLILGILQEVKDKLNTPLNNAGLIFRPTEEVDLDKIMRDIVDGG